MSRHLHASDVVDIIPIAGGEELSINGYRVVGWIDDYRRCTCGERLVYHMAYETFFCPRCNEWIDEPSDQWLHMIHSFRPLTPLPTRPTGHR